MRSPDLLGLKFNFLTVVSRVKKVKGPTAWRCKCDCGKFRDVSSTCLQQGVLRSCGCKKYTGKHGNEKKTPVLTAILAYANKYIQSARKRNIPWNLEPAQLFTIASGPCHYCGVLPYNTYNPYVSKNGYSQRKYPTALQKQTEITINGVDRVDNDRGYHLSNVVPCCWICQRAKSDSTLAEFETWLDRVSSFRQRQISCGL